MAKGPLSNVQKNVTWVPCQLKEEGRYTGGSKWVCDLKRMALPVLNCKSCHWSVLNAHRKVRKVSPRQGQMAEIWGGL